MVGREIDVARPRERASAPIGDVVLEVDGLSGRGRPRRRGACTDVSLAVRAGEILGVAGVAGNGQRELAEAVTGMRAVRARDASASAARALRGGDPRAAIAAGVAHVPEDRLGTRASRRASASRANVVLKSYREPRARRAGRSSRCDAIRERRRRADPALRREDARARTRPRATSRAATCRRSCSAREFSGEPRVLVVAAPTRGLDVGAIETVHAYLREAAGERRRDPAASARTSTRSSRSPTGSSSCTRARSSARSTPRAATVEEIGLLMAGGERRVIAHRAPARRSRAGCPSPCRSARSSSRSSLMAVVLAAHRARSARRPTGELFDAAFTGARRALATRSSRRRRSLFTGLAAAAAFRMQLFNIGAEGQLYFGAIGASRHRASARAGRTSTPLLDRWRCASAAACRRRALGADPGRPAGVRSDERDHHLADAQLRRRRSLLTYLIFDSALVLARHVDAPGAGRSRRGSRCPTRPAGRRFGSVGRRPVRVPRSALGVAVGALGALLAHALRLRGAGDRRLAARRALRGHAHAAEDPRGHGLSGAIAGHRRREPDRRLPHTLDASPQGLQAANYGYTGIVVAALAPLQPVRGRARRVPASAGCRTPATRSRAPTSRPASSA